MVTTLILLTTATANASDEPESSPTAETVSETVL